MIHQYTHTLYIYVALPCEAKPLVEYFNLKKQLAIKPFDVYLNKDICLTVTGLGKSAMAAGVAYTQALLSSNKPVFLLNLGVAGHHSFALGDLYLITKIMDADSQRSYYPFSLFSLPCSPATVQTVSKPVLAYDPVSLSDMEASAFYETATRFVSSEYVFCLKVISDNQSSSFENIQAKQVSEWIANYLSVIEELLNLAIKQAQLRKISPNKVFLDLLMDQYYFTVNEREQLKSLIEKWDVLTNQKALLQDQGDLTTAKSVLQWLETKVSRIEYFL